MELLKKDEDRKRMVEMSRMMGEDRDAPKPVKKVKKVKKDKVKTKKIFVLKPEPIILEEEEEVITPAPAPAPKKRGRPKLYATKEEAYKAKLAQNRGYIENKFNIELIKERREQRGMEAEDRNVAEKKAIRQMVSVEVPKAPAKAESPKKKGNSLPSPLQDFSLGDEVLYNVNSKKIQLGEDFPELYIIDNVTAKGVSFFPSIINKRIGFNQNKSGTFEIEFSKEYNSGKRYFQTFKQLSEALDRGDFRKIPPNFNYRATGKFDKEQKDRHDAEFERKVAKRWENSQR
jgi:hypothetical protein